jgi:hypothetical protein
MPEMTLSRHMEQMRAENLKKVATLLGMPQGITRKAEVIDWLAKHIRISLPNVLRHCADDEKSALAEAAFGGGILDPDAFWGKYGKLCPEPRHNHGYRETPSPFDLLVAPDEVGKLYVEDAVAERLRDLLPEPTAPTVAVVENDLPEMHAGRLVHVHSGERIVFHELRRVLGLAQAGKLAVTAKRGTPTDACVRRIAEALALPDLDLEEPEQERKRWFQYPEAGPVRAYAWGVVVQPCGWCKPVGSKLGLTRKGLALLADGRAEALKEGVERLLRNDDFDELNRINHIRGQTGKGKLSLTRPSSRRESIAASMLDWPTAKWIAFDDAFRFICASGNTFSVAGKDAWDLYFCEKQYGSLGYAYRDRSDRDGLERQYLRAFLVETMATLGLVDLAYVYPHNLWPEFGGRWGTDELGFCGRYDGLLHVRMTALGAYCLGSADTYTIPVEESSGLVKILPNLDLVLVNDTSCSAADTARLELFASPGSERVWRIDRKRILAHIESGGSMAGIRRELASVSDGSFPETVTALLTEIERKSSTLKSGQPCLLIEVADEATATLIAHDPGASKHCLLAGERHLAVPARNERAFRAAVKKLGYVLPR